MNLPAVSRKAAAVALLALAATAHASCGAAYCTLMTDRFANGAGQAHLGWNADIHLDLVTQDQLRRGSEAIAASDVTGEDAIERRTRNQSLVTTLSYGLDAQWTVAARWSLLKRSHDHDLLDDTTRQPGASEHWDFTRPGDLQLTARRQGTIGDDPDTAWALFGGLKLPTGSTQVSNAEGQRAERALQPGTGTTDLLIGVAGRRVIGLTDATMTQLSALLPLNNHEGYRPGAHFEASIGWSHAFSPSVGAVLQLNLSQRGRDRGDQAEPDNSGSTTVQLSPGVTFAAGAASTVYAYVQQPLYQRVNGIQLMPRQAFALGWTTDF